MSPDVGGPDKPQARRDGLEEEKLALEIRKLRRGWLLDPEYLSAIVPIAVAALGFTAAWMGGFFDQQRQRSEAHVRALRDTLALLETDRARLSAELTQLRRPLVFDVDGLGQNATIKGINFGNDFGTIRVTVRRALVLKYIPPPAWDIETGPDSVLTETLAKLQIPRWTDRDIEVDWRSPRVRAFMGAGRRGAISSVSFYLTTKGGRSAQSSAFSEFP